VRWRSKAWSGSTSSPSCLNRGTEIANASLVVGPWGYTGAQCPCGFGEARGHVDER
jgi:hypothetical protein